MKSRRIPRQKHKFRGSARFRFKNTNSVIRMSSENCGPYLSYIIKSHLCGQLCKRCTEKSVTSTVYSATELINVSLLTTNVLLLDVLPSIANTKQVKYIYHRIIRPVSDCVLWNLIFYCSLFATSCIINDQCVAF